MTQLHTLRTGLCTFMTVLIVARQCFTMKSCFTMQCYVSNNPLPNEVENKDLIVRMYTCYIIYVHL